MVLKPIVASAWNAVFVVSTFGTLAISAWHVGSSVEVSPPTKMKWRLPVLLAAPATSGPY
jgi:hypothetical protein